MRFFVSFLLLSLFNVSLFADGLSRRQFLIGGCVAGMAYAALSETPPPSYAVVSWEIAGLPSAPAHGKVTLKESLSVGELTLQILEEAQIPYEASEVSVHSIAGLGEKTIVTDSKNKRAYGWCFEINGKQPGFMPSQIQVEPGQTRLRWFYGYIPYENGEWTTDCKPAAP